MRVLTHGSPAAAVQYFEFLRKAQLLDGKLSIAKVARTRTLARQSRCAMRMSRAQLSSAIGTHLTAPGECEQRLPRNSTRPRPALRACDTAGADAHAQRPCLCAASQGCAGGPVQGLCDRRCMFT